METVIIASNNAHKIKEFKEMFGKDVSVLSLRDVGFIADIEENGATFEENSLIKAKTVGDYLKTKGVVASVLADDSGLCVEALGGAPGVFSARYAGLHGDDALNRKKLFDDMKDVADRRAYFCCVIAEYYPDGTHVYAEGRTYGKVTYEEKGYDGFGYDCMFFSDDLQKTFGEASADEKNAVSHRGRALQKLLEIRKK